MRQRRQARPSLSVIRHRHLSKLVANDVIMTRHNNVVEVSSMNKFINIFLLYSTKYMHVTTPILLCVSQGHVVSASHLLVAGIGKRTMVLSSRCDLVT